MRIRRRPRPRPRPEPPQHDTQRCVCLVCRPVLAIPRGRTIRVRTPSTYFTMHGIGIAPQDIPRG